jgi:PKD repeat protein
VKIAIGAAAVSGIAISANPSTVSANGGTSTIVARVNDSSGNALANVPVTFTTDAGAVNPVVASTDASGNAQTTLTTNKTAKVTATAGISGTSGTTAVAAPSATVTVTVNLTSAITVGTITPATPTVGQTVSVGLTYPSTTGGSPITRVIVDWGDGSPAQTYSGQPSGVSHAYSAAGSYLVRITGVDSFGDTSTASASITVTNRPQPTVAVSAPDNATAGTATKITIAATPPTGTTIQSITVDFGDTTSQTFQGNVTSVQHVYAANGSYTISAIATDSNGGTGSGSTGIVVGGGTATTAEFSVSPSSSPTHPATISVNGSTSTSPSPITNYAWDFGDPLGVNNSVSGASANASHNYLNAGTYTITLTTTDSAGRTASKQHTVTIG